MLYVVGVWLEMVWLRIGLLECITHYTVIKLYSSAFSVLKKQSLCLKQFNIYILLATNGSHWLREIIAAEIAVHLKVKGIRKNANAEEIKGKMHASGGRIAV